MKYFLFFLGLLMICENTYAQDTSVNTKKTRRSKSQSLLQKKYYDVSAQFITWQEMLDASGPSISGTGRFQFNGYQFGLSHNRPMGGIRWVRQYSSYLTIGTTKGIGETGTFTDEFKNQLWFALGASAGFIYRTTAVSEVGFFAPVSFRYINWQLAANAAIELEKETSFSAGLGFLYTQRFSTKSALVISVAHQFLWDATQWTIGYQYSLR